VVAVGWVVLDRLWLRPVQAAWARTSEALLQAQTQLEKGRHLVDNRDRIEGRWAPMAQQKARNETRATFLQHLSELEDRAGISERSRTPLRIEKQQDHMVAPFRLEFKCTLSQLVRFLDALERSKRFLRVSNLRISGTRTGEVDVSMEVSTLLFPRAAGERRAS